tara:strand:- start:558 stop:1055 length:498 start_codon:yes stop_codon:yes gene_type:complete
MKNLKTFSEFINESTVNEDQDAFTFDNLVGIHSLDGYDTYMTFPAMFFMQYGEDEMKEMDKNYKPACKYLGVKDTIKMGRISTTTAGNSEQYHIDFIDKIIKPQMKSSNLIGSNKGRGFDSSPAFTAVYKGKIDDEKVIICINEDWEDHTVVLAAIDNRGRLLNR